MTQSVVSTCPRSGDDASLSRRHLLKAAAAAALAANLSLSSLIPQAAPQANPSFSLAAFDSDTPIALITSDAPIDFDNYRDQYWQYPAIGSAIQPMEDVRIDIAILREARVLTLP